MCKVATYVVTYYHNAWRLFSDCISNNHPDLPLRVWSFTLQSDSCM